MYSRYLLSFLFLFITSYNFIPPVATQTVSVPTILLTGSGMPFVRTPDSFFKNVKGFPYESNYASFSGLRMAYVDEGAPTFGTILLLHTVAQWGYSYRKFVPILTRAGFRVIIPDFIGSGKSDKPTERSAYNFSMHVASIKSLTRSLNLTGINMFGMDWGANIGLAAAVDEPDLFDTVILGNFPILPNTTEWPVFDQLITSVNTNNNFAIPEVVQGSTNRILSPKELYAFSAPFPSRDYMEGIIAFPNMTPLHESHPEYPVFKEFQNKLKKWTKPVLLLWSLNEPFFGSIYKDVIETIPGTKDQPHQLFLNTGTVILEDAPKQLSIAIAQQLRKGLENKNALTCS